MTGSIYLVMLPQPNSMKVNHWHVNAEGITVGIFTEYENMMGTMCNKFVHPREKLVPIIKYNTNMKGVDSTDQMLSYYPFERKIFIHTIQMIMNNSWFLYHTSNVNKMPLYDFHLPSSSITFGHSKRTREQLLYSPRLEIKLQVTATVKEVQGVLIKPEFEKLQCLHVRNVQAISPCVRFCISTNSTRPKNKRKY